MQQSLILEAKVQPLVSFAFSSCLVGLVRYLFLGRHRIPLLLFLSIEVTEELPLHHKHYQ